MGTTPIIYTPQSMASQLMTNINSDQAQQAVLEQQISSGDTISEPSDNPALAADSLNLNNGVTQASQYVSNATDGTAWLSTANSTLNNVVSTLQTVISNVESVSGSQLTGGSAGLIGIQQNLTASLQLLSGLANTQYNGQAIFAGTGTTYNPSNPGAGVTQAYDANGNYLGNSTVPTRTVAPGIQVPVSLTGPTVFGSGTSGLLGTGSGGSSVGVLQQTANDLASGNISAVTGTDLQNLQSALQTAENAAANAGAAYQNMTSFAQQANDTQQALETQLTNIDSTNMPQAISELSQAQNSYQAALWAASQISQSSLMQYLS